MANFDSIVQSAGGATGLLGSGLGVISGISNLFGPSYEDIARQNQQWQSEENQKNRDWQSQEWQRQFDVTNAYNDPRNQVRRLVNAGLNPNVAFGGSAGGLGQSMASPSAPSGASGSVTTPFDSSFLTHGFVAADSLGRMADVLSRLPRTKEEIKNTASSSRLIEKQIVKQIIDNDMADFERSMQVIYGDAMHNATVRKLIAEYEDTAAHEKLNIALGREADEHSLALVSERLLNDSRRFLTGQEFELLKKRISWFDDEMKAEIEERRASAESARAAAEDYRVSAEGKRFYNELNRENKNVLVQSLKADLSNKVNQSKLTEKQQHLVRWLADKAQKEANLVEVRAYVEMAHMILGDIINGVGEFTKIGAINQLSRSKMQEVYQKERELNYKYGDTYEVHGHDARGRKVKATSHEPRGSSRMQIYSDVLQ